VVAHGVIAITGAANTSAKVEWQRLKRNNIAGFLAQNS